MPLTAELQARLAKRGLLKERGLPKEQEKPGKFLAHISR